MTFPVRRALVVLLTGALGCGSDLLLPDPTGGLVIGALTKVDGDQQTGTVGEALLTPLVVQVLTQNDEPAGGVQVTFELSDPAAGTVNPATATTNTAGEAVANWTLDPSSFLRGWLGWRGMTRSRSSMPQPDLDHLTPSVPKLPWLNPDAGTRRSAIPPKSGSWIVLEMPCPMYLSPGK
jgi:hypothetical protein